MLIENSTGQMIPMCINPIKLIDIQHMKSDWTLTFDWTLYFEYENVEVYILTTEHSNYVEGAIALEYRGDHVWIHLIEKAPRNRAPQEKYKYIAHHLFAFATKRHLDQGGDGFVAFDSKTGLITHYIKEYSAERIGTTRMMIPCLAGQHLIDVYLNKGGG